MPTRLRLHMHLDGSGEPEPEHLRAFGSGIFERGFPAKHDASAKAHSVGRLTHLEPGLWQLDLAVADDHLVEIALSRLTRHTPVFLGPLRGETVDTMNVLACQSWGELRSSLPVSAVRFSFDTPVHFRSSQRKIIQPEPLLIFRHLRDRWHRWAPDSVPDVDFRAIDWSLLLDGASIVSTGPGRYNPRSRRRAANRITVWAGVATVMIDRASNADRHSLGALAQAAPFFGIGANTTAGFGATEVALSYVDE